MSEMNNAGVVKMIGHLNFTSGWSYLFSSDGTLNGAPGNW